MRRPLLPPSPPLLNEMGAECRDDEDLEEEPVSMDKIDRILGRVRDANRKREISIPMVWKVWGIPNFEVGGGAAFPRWAPRRGERLRRHRGIPISDYRMS